MGRFAAKAATGKFSNLVVTTFKAYLDNPDVAKQDNPVTNRPKSQRLYIIPFTRQLPANYFAVASASQPVVAQYLTQVNTGAGSRTLDELNAGTQFAIKIDEFAAARVAIRTGRTETGTRKKSKTSGLPYKYYGGRSVSIPFGRGAAGESQQAAFEAIQADIAPPGSANAPLVTLIPEKPGRE